MCTPLLTLVRFHFLECFICSRRHWLVWKDYLVSLVHSFLPRKWYLSINQENAKSGSARKFNKMTLYRPNLNSLSFLVMSSKSSRPKLSKRSKAHYFIKISRFHAPFSRLWSLLRALSKNKKSKSLHILGFHSSLTHPQA